jgi:nudix-type nucleoside diphosphatase (YffH/AdpP family)
MPDQVRIYGKTRVFDGFFKIDEVEVSYERFDGVMTPAVKRISLERGDSVAAIVFNRSSQRLMFTRQFRYPTYEKGPGWIVEIVAGMQEVGEDPEVALRREILEEAGYQAHSIELIARFYVSPGGSSERVTVYYVEVTSTGKVAAGGGLIAENEDIETVWLSPDELRMAIDAGAIQDAKTLIGALWFFNRTRNEN